MTAEACISNIFDRKRQYAFVVRDPFVRGIEVTIVSVEGTACGFSAVISASKINRDLISVTVDSDCEIIERWSQGFLEFNWRESFRPDSGITQLVKGEMISHAACPIPFAVRKAIDVEYPSDFLYLTKRVLSPAAYFLDTKLTFPYITATKKRQSEGDHPPDGKGCAGIESVRFDYRVGTMIEITRAALTADEIATAAEFFSFGANDLTRPPSASPGAMRTDFCPIPFETVPKGFRKRNPFRQTCMNF